MTSQSVVETMLSDILDYQHLGHLVCLVDNNILLGGFILSDSSGSIFEVNVYQLSCHDITF